MRRRVLFAALSVAVAAAPIATAAANCVSRDEHSAFHVRLLQTELMVAALSCRGADYPQRYDAFVRKFQPTLVGHGKALSTYFKKSYGKNGTNQLDRYITSVANDASHRSMTEVNFCQAAAGLFDSAMRVEGKDLAKFSATLPFAGRTGQTACASDGGTRTAQTQKR